MPWAWVEAVLPQLTSPDRAYCCSRGEGAHGRALVAISEARTIGGPKTSVANTPLDKVIGEAAASGTDLSRAIAVLSGRAGFDLVVKCLRVRIPIIVPVSAPSALAFGLSCHGPGATMIGFARGDRLEVYASRGRLT